MCIKQFHFKLNSLCTANYNSVKRLKSVQQRQVNKFDEHQKIWDSCRSYFWEYHVTSMILTQCFFYQDNYLCNSDERFANSLVIIILGPYERVRSLNS